MTSLTLDYHRKQRTAPAHGPWSLSGNPAARTAGHRLSWFYVVRKQLKKIKSTTVKYNLEDVRRTQYIILGENSFTSERLRERGRVRVSVSRTVVGAVVLKTDSCYVRC